MKLTCRKTIVLMAIGVVGVPLAMWLTTPTGLSIKDAERAKQGMSRSVVHALLGKPTRVSPSFGTRSSLMDEWDATDGTIHIDLFSENTFQDWEVTYVSVFPSSRLERAWKAARAKFPW